VVRLWPQYRLLARHHPGDTPGGSAGLERSEVVVSTLQWAVLAVDLDNSASGREHPDSALPAVGYRCHHQPGPGLWQPDCLAGGALCRPHPGLASPGACRDQQPVPAALVIVGSTLVIAALIQPLRRGLQALIDRRFYRSKYDAARITAAFSATLRNEVDLDQLREQLIAVVQETMQPSHVSLWVRQPRRANAPSLQMSKPLPEEAEVGEKIAGHGV
jgi:hypothetical protein